MDNTGYPEIADDYERTFKTLRSLTADVFLGPHPMFFRMAEKRQAAVAAAAGTNPFVDPSELRTFVERSERDFRAALQKQRQ